MDDPDRSLDIRALLDPAVFPHPVDRVELVETHLSWLLLAGERVYKLNRPVRLDFVDFSSRGRREASCREGLRLNRRLAPELYLDVVPITCETDGRLLVAGQGEPIEYALVMRRFAEEALLSRALPEGRLRPEHLDRLAQRIADFHDEVAVAGIGSGFGSPTALAAALDGILGSLIDGGPDGAHARTVAELASWCRGRLEGQAATIRQRQAAGRVREGHGDLHLGNMFLEDDRVTVFDAIDFDPALRWIDVLNDVAFCIMDLRAWERDDLAQRFLDRYLQRSGDYEGVVLLQLYVVYRALVRAKVARLRLGQVAGGPPAEAAANTAILQRYLSLAQRSTRSDRPRLLITHGLSGSGKSWLSERVPELIGGLRLRSDLERRRLPEGPQVQPATVTARAQVYRRLLHLAETLLGAGSSVIVDATFLERAQRRAFCELARRQGVDFGILAVHAPEALLRQRIADRAAAGTDPSEADQAVLDEQLRTIEVLDAEERRSAIVIDSSAPDAPQQLIAAVRR